MSVCWETLRRGLRRLDWRYRRARRRTSKTPAPHRVAAARKAIEEFWVLESAGKCDLIYGDESGFCLQPALFRCWQPPGPTLCLPAQAHSKRLNVVGFLRKGDGALVHFAREGRLGAAEFIEAVESRLLPALAARGRPAVLVLDKGPCHRARLIKAKRAEWRAKGLRLLFCPRIGGTACRRWRGLYDHFQSRRPDYTDTVEEQLIQHLCSYLEAEQIVSTWNPKQILDYGPGVVAKRAMRNLFQQIETRLADRKEDYETKVMCDNDTEWPRMGIGRHAWTSIFGPQGYHNKVSLYYQTKVAWQGGQECFCLEINLWHRAHSCDWQVAKAKLPQWEAALRQGGYTIRAEPRWGKSEKREAGAAPLVEAPARVCALCWEPPALGYVSEDDLKTMTDIELLNVLTDWVLRFCDTVSKLA